MLTKNDLSQIGRVVEDKVGKVVEDRMRDAMVDFYEQVIFPFPYFDERLNETNKKVDFLTEEVTEIKEDVGDLVIKSNQNTREHDRIFVKLDSIEKKVDGHERRIKHLEKNFQTS